MEAVKPTIKLYLGGILDESTIRPILLGMEEEGVPCEIERQDNQDALLLSIDACSSSVLGVGVGLSPKEAILHFNKLPDESPLFRVPASAGEEALRTLGANAARLVKKVPFIREDKCR